MVINVHLLQALLLKLFEHTKWKAGGGGMDDCITRRFMVFYSIPNSIRIIKERRMKQTGHVTSTGHNRNAYGFS